LSSVALALDWPFSGHVWWNVLFLAHLRSIGIRRGAWVWLWLASMAYLFVMKAIFQTSRDLVGGVISLAGAIVFAALLLRGRRHRAAA
jgi:hypothetical protein